MRARRSVPALLALSVLAVAGACRDSGDDGNNPIDARDGDAPDPDDMKIQMVQDDLTPVGTAVTLRGVVVVAKDTYGNRTGNFYVMEPEGGAFSGVLVFGAPLAQVDALAVGDLVDITDAEKDEFSLATDTATITELVGAAGGMMTVTKVGTGTVPAPHVVDALATGRLPEAERKAEQEKWEHVLIKVENVSVTREIRPINGNPPDPTFKDFLITGYYNVDSSLAEIADTAVMRGDCLASITGMGDYFFNYKILPRASSDIVTGGSNCPAPEADAIVCADGIDNDANGFFDCNDRSCLAAVPACTATTTVVNIENGTIPNLANVNLNNVVVTGIAFNHKNLWVADSLQAAPYNGVYVFRGSGAAVLPDTIVVGATVTVSGQVFEFNGNGGGDTQTEIRNPTVTFGAAPTGATVALDNVPLATLLDNTMNEQYEGVLVTLHNVKVTSTLNGTTGQRDMAAGAVTFKADDDFFRLLDANGTCYASLVGVWNYNPFSDTNAWVFLPRGGTYGAPASDIVLNGTCP